MINCKYDLLKSEYRDGKYIIYKPDSLSNTTALQVRSTNFDPLPDVKTNSLTRVMHTKLSIVNSDAKRLEPFRVRGTNFGMQAAYDTINIPQFIYNSSNFALNHDVVYDSTISAEENVKKVIKMYSDEVKQWLFNFSATNPDSKYFFNSAYVKQCLGGCVYDITNVDTGNREEYVIKYNASNAYITRIRGKNRGSFTLLIPTYAYNHFGITSPDTVNSNIITCDSGYVSAITLSAAMTSPKMQFPDPSRGNRVLFMQNPITFAFKSDGARMHYIDYTSTSYDSNVYMKYKGVDTKFNMIMNASLLFTPTCMFWNKGGIHIGYITASTPAVFSIAYCKYSEESSALTNTATVVYGDTEVQVKISDVLPNLEMDSNHLGMLVPMYHYEREGKNYFVVALFHNVNTVSAADKSSYKGLFILCMETGDIYNAKIGYNYRKFALDRSFDVTNLLYMYGWQQYDDAYEVGSNMFQYTISMSGLSTVYTFNSKRIEICPYKAFGNYYLVCNPELYSTWYVYDIDNHRVHAVTNVPCSRNHCITPDGMHGFRFEVNNKTDYVINNNFIYQPLLYYDENVINSIGLIRPTPVKLSYSLPESYEPYTYLSWNGLFAWNLSYKYKQEFDPIDINKTTATFFINKSEPHNIKILYFVVDITTDDNYLEFHHKRITPEHANLSSLEHVDIPYTLVDNTASTSLTPYNNIKVYLNEFLNSDTFVSNSNDLIDVKLKQSSITTTNRSFRIILYDENNNIITQDELRKKYGVATIDIDFLMNT